eukprot:SAG31_NODE_4446_length_3223_cov_12.388922_1_plen_716_part_10
MYDGSCAAGNQDYCHEPCYHVECGDHGTCTPRETYAGTSPYAGTCACVEGWYTASCRLFDPCPPGTVNKNRTGTTSCFKCAVGMYESTLSGACEECPVGKYANTNGATDCTWCEAGKWSSRNSSSCTSDCPDLQTSCTMIRTDRADGKTGCPAGSDIDTVTITTIDANVPAICVECPFKHRCPGDAGACAIGSNGNLCGSCRAGYYNAGPFCARCSGSKATSVLIGVAVGLLIFIIVWIQTRVRGAKGLDINCMISFDRKKGPRDAVPGIQIARDLKEAMVNGFGWADENILFDYGGDSTADDWPVLFRAGALHAPAMLFSLTQSWCEKNDIDAEMAWYLVLKTVGVEVVLQSAFAGAAAGTELNDILKADILQNVLSLEPKDREPLWDGVFFIVFSDVSSDLEGVLRELDCPESHIAHFERKQEMFQALDTFVSSERSQPALQQRRRAFARSYTEAARKEAKRTRSQSKKAKDTVAAIKTTLETGQDTVMAARNTATTIKATLKTGPQPAQTATKLAGTVEAAVLRRALTAKTAELAAQVHSLVASITLPHFTFSMLPLLAIHVQLPAFISNLVDWFHSFAFLDFGVISPPECLIKETASPAGKKLSRFLTAHGAFLALLVFLQLIRCCACCKGRKSATPTQTTSAHAVNASVFMFLLGHATLLRSSLGVLHCIGSGHEGRLQSDPDVPCDLRSTWVVIAVGMAMAVVGLSFKLL